MQEAIFRNIKWWIGYFGTDILDLLLVVDDCNSLDPNVRYANFEVTFDKHFSLWSHFATRVGVGTPSILLKLDKVEDLGGCDTKYDILFIVSFNTLSPTFDADGDQRSKQIGHSPEALLRYVDRMTCAITSMVRSTYFDHTGTLMERDVFDDMADIAGWEYPLRMGNRVEFTQGNINAFDEQLSFSIGVRLDIEDLNCNGTPSVFCKEC